jgi:hypothetical protein
MTASKKFRVPWNERIPAQNPVKVIRNLIRQMVSVSPQVPTLSLT